MQIEELQTSARQYLDGMLTPSEFISEVVMTLLELDDDRAITLALILVPDRVLKFDHPT